MTLSERESRIFAEIERTLQTEDPDLERLLADPRAGRRRLAVLAVVLGLLVASAGLLAGALLGLPALPALVLVPLGLAPALWGAAELVLAWWRRRVRDARPSASERSY